LRALWATVHQVTDAEQPIHGGIETDGLQLCLQALKVTVNIAHGIIPAVLIDSKPLDPTHGVLPNPPTLAGVQ
jgi:hypothetical protein